MNQIFNPVGEKYAQAVKLIISKSLIHTADNLLIAFKGLIPPKF